MFLMKKYYKNLKLLEKKPNIKLGIIEKDSKVGQQQSGHNSGVIHSGIYYKPGSFKANFCVAGRKSMTDYCLENEIPVWTCGKLIVATDKASEARLDDLEERGKANNVEGLRIVYKDEIREIEPHQRIFFYGGAIFQSPKIFAALRRQ